MIEKLYLYNNKKDNLVSVTIEVPWNQTNLSYVIIAMDDKLKGLSGFFVEDYSPISYNPETKTFLLNVVLDVEEVDFSEFED